MVKIGSKTPWGIAEDVEDAAPGIWQVGTASHGGIKLDSERNAKIPAYMRVAGGWYEEDCDYAKVVMVFPEAFSKAVVEAAGASFRQWFPDAFEQFTGETLLDGQSWVRDQRLFEARHRGDFVVTAAWGDHTTGVPKGMVGVLAAVGGRRDAEAESAHFLVPASEYAERGQFGFVIVHGTHKLTKKTW